MGTMTTNKGGRKRTGTVEPWGTHADGTPRFRFRLMLDDGTRTPRYDVPHGMDETKARAYVAGLQAQEDAEKRLLVIKRDRARSKAEETRQPHDGETWNAWFARYLPTKECGESHRRISEAVANKWISPVIGTKAVRSLTRDDVEDVRDKLDHALDAKEIRPSTARNAWSVLTGALKSAYAARDRSLRVHSSPLHFGILPPKRGASRQRPWLYPREWSAYVNCAAVPVEWRQAAALALYTGLRPGELRALTWSDVDLDALTITVSKAHDEETGGTKAPKTAQSQRVIPLHPELVPMLRAIEGEPGDPVVTIFDEHEDRMADVFRSQLRDAGIERARLWSDTDTEEPADFRTLRDSHATWLALSGVNDKVIQRRLGHASPTTTDRYIKAAESFSTEHIGTPFPPLPGELLSRVVPTKVKIPGKRRGFLVARVGFEARKQGDFSHPSASDPRLSPVDSARCTPGTRGSGQSSAQLDDALAAALRLATERGDLALVTRIVGELEARRRDASGNVIPLSTKARKR